MEETKMWDVSSKVFYLLLAVVIVIGVAVLSQLSFQFKNSAKEFQITGQGKAYAKPDVAVATFGMTSNGQDIKSLTNDTNTKMNKIISDIKGLGVDEKDIQTTQYSVTPQYNYSPTGNRTFSGYQIDQQVTVKIRDFSKTGDVITAATNDGANNIGDLQFTVDNMDSVNAEARGDAINDAKSKAETIARQSGLKLGRLVNVTEGYSSPMPMMYNSKDMAVGSAAQAVTPSIQPGQQEVDSNVTLTYVIE